MNWLAASQIGRHHIGIFLSVPDPPLYRLQDKVLGVQSIRITIKEASKFWCL
jgi:hypothetical protein